MDPHLSTTPFGRRTLTLAHVANQAIAKTRPLDKSVHKWTVFRAICAAKTRLGLTERSLAVLDALLSFHPETVLTGDSLIVFPSNDQLALRAHGMAPSTLRRNLAGLVDAGVIIRRDSPNGKRYARKGRDGAINQAFGFDLSPLVARAEEFEAWAEDVRAAERALRLERERITLLRRDIAKMIATGVEEGVPTRRGGQGPADWAELHALYRGIVGRLPRTAALADLEPIADELSLLAEEILSLLETHVKTSNLSANESQSERHKQNSNPNPLPESEPGLQESRAAAIAPRPPTPRVAEANFPLRMVLDACPDIVDYAKDGISNWRDLVATAAMVRAMLGVSPSAWEEAQTIMGERQAAAAIAPRPPTPRVAEANFPLGMVLDACPDIVDYAKDGISNWRDLVATAAMVRAMLGVSPSAWEEAQTIMGERQAATVIAAILQRAEAIVSAGGYLRDLTRKAEAGEFSLGPMLMALIGSRKRGRKRA